MWSHTVRRWFTLNTAHRGRFADRNLEYYLYQTLAGAWPVSEDILRAHVRAPNRYSGDRAGSADAEGRYGSEVDQFIRALFSHDRFLEELRAFVSRIEHAGYVKSLTQTLLKLTLPGVPDIYQGSELWDFSVAGQDSDRAVDFAHRVALLESIDAISPSELSKRMRDGSAKLFLLKTLLMARQRHPETFAWGSYTPLYASGCARDCVVAFLRAGAALIVAPRWTLSAAEGWTHEGITVPDGRWVNLFTGEIVNGGYCRLGTLLRSFPVAAFYRAGTR